MTQKRKKSLEDQYWSIRAAEAYRVCKELDKKWHSRPHPETAKIPKGPNKTRSSYTHASRTKFVERYVPCDFGSPQVDYLPGSSPALYDRVPVLSVKNILEWLVIRREGRRECLAARGFTKCCAPEAYCKNKRCAKCWALSQKKIKGVTWVVREVISGATPKIVDPFGVDPKGKRGKSKGMDLETRAQFKLTSNIHMYKQGNSAWKP